MGRGRRKTLNGVRPAIARGRQNSEEGHGVHILSELTQTSVELRWDAVVPGPAETRARQLRGALAGAFVEDSRFHQRDREGRLVYRYPCIQYRWRYGHGVVVGWAEGAEILRNLPWLDLELALGRDRVRVTDAFIGCRSATFAVSDRLHRYRLGSPALLFNQDNYQRYRTLDEVGQSAERDRLLTAQLLTALRGLGITFPERLYATFCDLRTHTCRFKEQDLLGLTGVLVCNVLLPPGFAIGHAVSHGYGWMEPGQASDI